jgi:hypothetical protein
MRCQIIAPHAQQQHQEGHIGERRAGLAAREYEPGGLALRILAFASRPTDPVHDGERPRGQRDAVLLPGLHAFG